MKKETKIQLLEQGIAPPKPVRFYTRFEPFYYYYYPNAVNEQFLLGQEENDFQLDGYHIRKIAHIDKVECKDDLCPVINEWNGVVKEVRHPGIDISSWNSIAQGLSAMGRFLIIEDEKNELFAIGRIRRVCKRHIVFEHFDANGIWQDEPLRIPYSTITHIAWDTRYANNWEAYLRSRGEA